MSPFDIFLFDVYAEITLLSTEVDSVRDEINKKPAFMRPALMTAIGSMVRAQLPPEVYGHVEAAFNARIEAKKAARFFYEMGVFELIKEES
jgi:hypothetical protein